MGLREQLRRQLLEVGAETQRGVLFGRLKRSQEETSTIVEHLLYEDMMFHPRHFTMAMRSLARRGLWPDALRLLPEMRKRQLTPNCLSYNVAMDACQKGHAWQRAIGLWQDMELASATPDAVSCSTVVGACDKAGKWHLALSFFRSHFAGDPQAVLSVLATCSRAALWEAAVDLMEQLSRRTAPDLHCHNALLNALGKAERWQETLSSFSQLASSDAISYNTTMSALADGHHWQRALRLFEELKSSGLQLSRISFNTAITSLLADGQDRSLLAEQLKAEMLGWRLAPMADTYRLLIHAQLPSGDWHRVLELLQEMKANGLAQDSETLSCALQVVGDHPSANELYRQAQQLGFDPFKRLNQKPRPRP